MSASGWWLEPEDMDEEQQRVVALPIDGKYLVTGKPGSGKTNLLVLRGAYLIRAGHDDLKVLTVGRLISEFITSGARHHGLNESQLLTFRSWAIDALDEIGVDVGELPNDYSELVKLLLENLQPAADEDALSHYDAILIDEVQDYPPAAIQVLGGLSDRLFFAGDDNQRIFGEYTSMADFEAAVDEAIELPFHYRNGLRICRVAEAIKNEADYVVTSRYNEERLPSRVTLLRCDSLEDQVERMKTELRSQLRGYPNQWLGVMVPLNKDVNEIVEMLREDEFFEPLCQFQTRAERNEPLSEDKPIIVSTIAAAKGLEYRAAHFVAMEGLTTFPLNKRHNVAYTAVTRAKTTLFGYYTGQIENWLKSAFNRGQDPRPTPTLRDVF